MLTLPRMRMISHKINYARNGVAKSDRQFLMNPISRTLSTSLKLGEQEANGSKICSSKVTPVCDKTLIDLVDQEKRQKKPVDQLMRDYLNKFEQNEIGPWFIFIAIVLAIKKVLEYPLLQDALGFFALGLVLPIKGVLGLFFVYLLLAADKKFSKPFETLDYGTVVGVWFAGWIAYCICCLL